MKVRVNIENLCKGEAAASALDVIVAPEDTVLSLKERIDVAAPVPLAKQELLLNDTVLCDTQQLSACGVKDLDSLVLRFKATEGGFAKQLAGLVQGGNGISPDELSLVYAHKHGFTVREALGSLGRGDEKLWDFLGRQKGLVCEGGLVKVQPAAAPRAAAAAPEKATLRAVLLKVVVSVVIRAAGRADQETDDVDVALDPSSTVAAAKSRIAQEALVPFPDCDLVLQGSVLREQALLADCAIKDGASLLFVVRASEEALAHQLKDILRAREALSPDQLATQYCVKHGAPLNQALKSLGLRITPRQFVERQAAFSVDGGCVRLAKGKGRSQKFERVARFLSEATTFLNVHSITEGGEDGEAILALRGLPPAEKAAWTPGLLRTVAAALEAQLGSVTAKTGGVVGVHCSQDAVQVLLEGGAVVNTRLAAA